MQLQSLQSLALVVAAALWLLTSSLDAQVLGGKGDSQPAPERQWLDEEHTVELLESGTGWASVMSYDVNDTLYAAGERYLVVSREGIDHVPLSISDREDLRADFEEDDAAGGGNTIGNAEQGPLEAFDFIIVSPENLGAASAAGGICSWKDKEVIRDFSLDRTLAPNPWNYSSGPFNGSFQAQLPIDGDAHLEVRFQVKKCFGIPVKWRMRETVIEGQVTLDGTTSLDGDVSYTFHHEREHKVLSTKLGQVTISGIPIKFRLHGFLGYSLKATLEASLGASANLEGTGTFAYRCHHREGCTGNSDFSSDGDSELTGSIEVDAEARAWGRLAVRAVVIDDWIAFAEASVRGWAGGDLWGYFGNACGDADDDGSNETVRALAADLLAGYEVKAELDSVFSRSYDWTIAEGQVHLGWFDLLGDRSAFQPIVLGPEHLEPGESGTYTIRMRPCYPYEKAVTLDVPPGFSGPLTLADPAEDTVTTTGSFAQRPSAALSITTRQDAAGRQLLATTQRTITVADRDDPPRITGHPSDAPAQQGGTVTLTVHAEGDQPMAYRWQRNGVNIYDTGKFSGTATPTLTVQDADIDVAGNYRVTIVNPHGTATSQQAHLSIAPECLITWLRGYDGVHTPPRIEWNTNCSVSGHTEVKVMTSTISVNQPSCQLEDAFWHSGVVGNRPADYMTGGYFGGCSPVLEAEFWIELRDRRDGRLIDFEPPVQVRYTPPVPLCDFDSFEVIDRGLGRVPRIVWSTDCTIDDDRVEVEIKASTLSEVPSGCRKSRETVVFDQPFGSWDADFMAGGYGPAHACPPVEHASFWLEIYQDGHLVSRTDYFEGYYQD